MPLRNYELSLLILKRPLFSEVGYIQAGIIMMIKSGQQILVLVVSLRAQCGTVAAYPHCMKKYSIHSIILSTTKLIEHGTKPKWYQAS